MTYEISQLGKFVKSSTQKCRRLEGICDGSQEGRGVGQGIRCLNTPLYQGNVRNSQLNFVVYHTSHEIQELLHPGLVAMS